MYAKVTTELSDQSLVTCRPNLQERRQRISTGRVRRELLFVHSDFGCLLVVQDFC